MTTFNVHDKDGGALVFTYAADSVVEWDQFPLAHFTHIAGAADAPPVAVDTTYGGRRLLTKIEFRRLFTNEELYKIDEFSANYALMAIGPEMKCKIRTSLKSYEEARDIALDDPEVKTGLELYVAIGCLSNSRIAEVLNG
jgi:hypothetical protein